MEQLPDDTDAAESSSIGVIVDALGAYLGKIPAALQRNISKAVGHLFKIPNAYLDGLAEEIKATSEARVKITKATGNKLAQAVEIDSSLAKIATQTHANKILRQQKNAIKVLQHAAEEISSAPHQQHADEPAEISDDWLNAFESEAVNMSSEQMQKLFGKMLAGEIFRPTTFSIRTVKMMGQMDIDVAEIFQKFCSMVSSYRVGEDRAVVDGRVISLGKKTNIALYNFGISHFEMLTLEEYGLLASAVPVDFPYQPCVYREHGSKERKISLTYNNKHHVLLPKPPKTADDFAHYRTAGIALSRVGRELLQIVELQENRDYTEALTNYFEAQDLVLYQIPDELVQKAKELHLRGKSGAM
jgi:hypothetical protein